MTRPDAERDARRDALATKLLAMGVSGTAAISGVRGRLALTDFILAEIDHAIADARAENERLRVVFEAAKRWRDADCNGKCEDGHHFGCPMGDTENDLVVAIDALAAPPAAPEPTKP